MKSCKSFFFFWFCSENKLYGDIERKRGTAVQNKNRKTWTEYEFKGKVTTHLHITTVINRKKKVFISIKLWQHIVWNASFHIIFCIHILKHRQMKIRQQCCISVKVWRTRFRYNWFNTLGLIQTKTELKRIYKILTKLLIFCVKI